jgi:hypothetical protein
MAERQICSRVVPVTVLEVEDNSEILVGPDKQVEEIQTLILILILSKTVIK